MGKRTVDSPPTDSCRLDWLSLTYFAASESLQNEQLNAWIDVFERFIPQLDFKEGGGRTFFDNSVFHDAGVAMRWSPPDGARNAGHLSIDLRGEFFKLTDPRDRAAIYLDAADLEGFKHCTRLDAQRTLIDPMADAEQIHCMVRDRECWVPRYKAFRQLAPTDSKGDAVNGASVVWGGPSSPSRGMTYNKAAEDKWDGVRAVRHEALLRRQPARDSFKVLLEMLLAEEGPSCRYLAEVRFVQSVLAKQMTYLNTSRLAAIRDKANWPENWAADSEPAEFWREVVEGEPVQLKVTWREERTLEESQRAHDEQWGRTEAKFCLWRIYGCGQSKAEVFEELFSAWCSRLKDEDLPGLVKLTPEQNKRPLAREFQRIRRAASKNLEAFASKDPIGGNDTPVL
jgi:hypothetical protein